MHEALEQASLYTIVIYKHLLSLPVMASSEPSSKNLWAFWESYVNKLRVAMKPNHVETDLHRLLAGCLNVYEDHLCVSSVDEALAVFSGYGCSPVEIAFMWMGRWRPTSAVVLVYSTMGVDLRGAAKESDGTVDQDFIDLNPLNEKQLSGLSALQKAAFEAESDLSQQLATLQMLLVEQSTVTALRLGETTSGESILVSEFQQLIDAKLKELQILLLKADNLRMHTLRQLVDILTPVQAASCIVAAFELMLALRSLSKAIQNPGC